MLRNIKTQTERTGASRALQVTTAVAASAAMLLSAAPQVEARGKIPVVLQLTNNTTGDIQFPKVRSQDGDRVIFLSTGDVTGAATAQPQLYLYEFSLDDDIYAHQGTMEQLTTDAMVPGGIIDAARSTDDVFASGRPDIIPFVSTADLDPNVDNSDGNAEVFVYVLTTDALGGKGDIRQVTNTVAPVQNANVFATDSAKCIVFDSNGDLDNNPGDIEPNNPGTQYSNPDGSREVFIYTNDDGNDFPYTGNFTQVSNGPAGTTSENAVIGGYWFPRQCQSTVYESDYDQTGGTRNGVHLYVYSRQRGGESESMIAPETPNGQPDGNYIKPHISAASPFARGPFTVFTTDADLWNNGTSGIHQLYRYRIFHPRQTQYTALTTGEIKNPQMSDGGGLITFETNGDVFNPNKIKTDGVTYPTNGDGNREIFFQKGRRKLTQLTNTTGCDNSQPSLRDDGTNIAWRSTCDIIPGNNAGGVPQVFLYTQVKSNDPLACKKASKPCECTIASGCCNEANGCLNLIQGGSVKPPKKNCLSKGNCPS